VEETATNSIIFFSAKHPKVTTIWLLCYPDLYTKRPKNIASWGGVLNCSMKSN